MHIVHHPDSTVRVIFTENTISVHFEKIQYYVFCVQNIDFIDHMKIAWKMAGNNE